MLLRHLPRGGLIADAGCGTGKWTSHLHRLGYRVFGIDISPNAAALARARDPNVALVVADTRRAPLRDHALDAVISLGVVEHEEHGPLPALRELRRLLKPGGILVLDVPYNSLLRRLLTNHMLDWATWRRRRARWNLGFMEYRFTRREVRGFLEQTGFEPLSAHPNDYRPPKNIGLWVDYHNIIFDPYKPPAPSEIFMLPPRLRRLAATVTTRAPWLACGTITFVARAR
ncbi:MAG TPA: class I SAM-dependent methyltransferase [Candidatus Binatia bacterium]|nr:class I SAM-dependent methyltransferase [Candidatus Binatia bacterium]